MATSFKRSALRRRVRGDGDHALVKVLEIEPSLTRREDLLEAVERALAGRIAGENAIEVRRGSIDFAEHLVVERGGALGEVDLDGRR